TAAVDIANSLSRRGFSSLVLPERKSKNPTAAALVRDEALAGEQLARLLDGRAGSGQDHVGGDELVVGEACAGAPHLVRERRHELLEPLRAAAVGGARDPVAELVQPVALRVRNAPLALARDAHDHGLGSSGAGAAAGVSLAGGRAASPLPAASSRFIRS